MLLLLYNLIGSLILVFSDTFHYGFVFEHKIGQATNPIGIYNHKIFDGIYNIFKRYFNWLFKLKTFTFLGMKFDNVPVYYRAFQKLVEGIVGLYGINYAYHHFGLLITICNFAIMLLVYFFMTYEFDYSIVLNQYNIAKAETSPYWLIKPYFLGGYFKPYTFGKFQSSAIIGNLIILLTFLITIFL